MSLYEHGINGESDQYAGGMPEDNASAGNVMPDSSVNAGSTGNGYANMNEGGFNSDAGSNNNTGSQSFTGNSNGNDWNGSWNGNNSYNASGTWNGNNFNNASGSWNGQNGYYSNGGNNQNGFNPNANAAAEAKRREKQRKREEKQRRRMMRKTSGKRGTGHPFLRKVGTAAAVAAVFGIVAGAAFEGTSYIANRKLNGTGSAASGRSLSTADKKSISSTATSSATTVTDVSDIVKNVMPAIVQVTNMSVEDVQSFFGTYRKPTESAGSGIIVSEDNDYIYIATNNHVVSNSTSLTITFNDGKSVSAEVKGTDEDSDLAVVSVKKSDISTSTMNSIKVATIGSSDNLSVGESAVVIGNALGYGQSVTTGVISALDRKVSIQDDNGNTISNKLIQTDAAVNPGNSGGALLNMKGEVVGIVSAKYSDTSVEGMGYAIPISKASSILQTLMNGGSVSHDSGSESTGSGAYLGIYGMDIDSSTSMQYKIPEGVYVMQVTKDSAAEKAGIEKGDVIESLNGKEITSFEDLKTALSKMNAGDKVKIKIAKGNSKYSTKTVEVKLGSRPDSESRE